MRIKGQQIDSSAIVARLLLFSIIWWALSDGSTASWLIGAPAVLCALIVSITLLPPVRLVWWWLAAFIPFFFWQSLKGGVKVALLAFQPSMSLSPKLVEYHLYLSSGLARVAMINIISLLPGTLSTKIDGDTLTIHVLDSQGDFLVALQDLERGLAQIFPNSVEPALLEDE